MRASLVNQLRVLVPVKRTIDYGKLLPTAVHFACISVSESQLMGLSRVAY